MNMTTGKQSFEANSIQSLDNAYNEYSLLLQVQLMKTQR